MYNNNVNECMLNYKEDRTTITLKHGINTLEIKYVPASFPIYLSLPVNLCRVLYPPRGSHQMFIKEYKVHHHKLLRCLPRSKHLSSR